MPDRYMRTLTPGMPVLSREAASPTRVSSDKSKEPRACACRVTNAADAWSAYGRRAWRPAEAARRPLRTPHVGPRHWSPRPLHTPWERTAWIHAAEWRAHLQFGCQHLDAQATCRELAAGLGRGGRGGQSTSCCRSRTRRCGSEAQQHGQAKGTRADRSLWFWVTGARAVQIFGPLERGAGSSSSSDS